MIRSVFKSGNSLVVALPGSLLDELQITEGSEVSVILSDQGDAIEISPLQSCLEIHAACQSPHRSACHPHTIELERYALRSRLPCLPRGNVRTRPSRQVEITVTKRSFANPVVIQRSSSPHI